MSKETDRVLGHADEADGIEEYDNPLPDWWLGLFWLTIVWAVGYTLHYHLIADRSQESELAAEMAAAEARYSETAPGEGFAMTPEAIEAGLALYTTNCAVCHGQDLEGGIGPSLVDDVWIHGGEVEEVIRTITEGVPEKGMLRWGPILGPDRINQVAAYVLSESMAGEPETPGDARPPN